MDKLLVICGPTAIGKTSTGIKLAKKFNGEIISADSRQVYKGLDIGTGKDIENSSIFNFRFSIRDFEIGNYKIDGVPVWLLDMAYPDQQVTVADWLKGARKVIEKLDKENKLPVVVGGTGFYIKGLVEGIDTLGIKPNDNLRKKLNQWPVAELQKKLKKIAPDVFKKLNRSDKNNPHRLIRKIEIAQARKTNQVKKNKYANGVSRDVLKIGLKAPKQVIYKRIDQRVKARLDQGLLEEIKNLLEEGYDWDDPGLNTLAYKEFEAIFAPGAEISTLLERRIKKWKFDEHGYARRQLTWFKADDQINWFDITENNRLDDLNELVHNWINNEYSKKNKKS